MAQKKAVVWLGIALCLSACATGSQVSSTSQPDATPSVTQTTVAVPAAKQAAEVPPPAPSVTTPAVAVMKSAQPSWSDGWYLGAEGYAQALDEYEKTNKPMAVYVNVTWCPYCRKFEKEILSSPLVQDFLRDKIKVHIDPEKSKQENTLVFQYGVKGFPSFYVHPPQPSGTVRLFTGVTPEQFIETFKKVLEQ